MLVRSIKYVAVLASVYVLLLQPQPIVRLPENTSTALKQCVSPLTQTSLDYEQLQRWRDYLTSTKLFK